MWEMLYVFLCPHQLRSTATIPLSQNFSLFPSIFSPSSSPSSSHLHSWDWLTAPSLQVYNTLILGVNMQMGLKLATGTNPWALLYTSPCFTNISKFPSCFPQHKKSLHWFSSFCPPPPPVGAHRSAMCSDLQRLKLTNHHSQGLVRRPAESSAGFKPLCQTNHDRRRHSPLDVWSPEPPGLCVWAGAGQGEGAWREDTLDLESVSSSCLS